MRRTRHGCASLALPRSVAYSWRTGCHNRVTRVEGYVTIVVWLVFTAVYAYVYIVNRINLPNAHGYEGQWDWQLIFFSLVRLPLLIVGLIIVLWLEQRLLFRR